VVDDEEQIRNLLRKLLVLAGHEVHTASDAKAAVEICAPPACFDLVISDVVMPGMDGHELAREVAVRCPDSRVILMSAFDPGCDDCPYLDNCLRISKPFRLREVADLVRDVLAQPTRPRRGSGIAGRLL
jgi:two-component system cell cycle response regulator CpdR